MPIDFPKTLTLTGAIEAITVQDPDDDKNTVLEIKRDWTVKAKWYVDGNNALFLGGTWHVSVIIESMGSGSEKTLKKIDVPVTATDPDPSVPPHALYYEKDIMIPATVNALPGEESVTEEGIYKMVLLVTYTTPQAKVGRIAGFSEGEMVQFYNFEVPY